MGSVARDEELGIMTYIINSHCTLQIYEPDSGNVFMGQPRYFPDFPERRWGAGESFDPIPFNCEYGLCRYSDMASIVESLDDTYEFGAIARPQPGTITIDPDNPRFTIVAAASGRGTNQTLHKVGRVTGWSSGEISHECVDIQYDGQDVTLLCQYRFKADIDDGDSGSPVFRISSSGTEAAFWGVAHGRYRNALLQTHVNYSPLDNWWLDTGTSFSYCTGASCTYP